VDVTLHFGSSFVVAESFAAPAERGWLAEQTLAAVGGARENERPRLNNGQPEEKMHGSGRTQD
jgi:hypothetical protein